MADKRRVMKLTTNIVLKDFKRVHGDRYDYSKVEYKNTKKKVKVICRTHGEFLISYDKHAYKGQGCKKCSIIRSTERMRDTTDNFIRKAKLIHGDKYDYYETVYGKTAHEKVKVICSDHGVFEISPSNHLAKGKKGCPKCTKRCTKALWKKLCKGKTAKFYIIRCFNEDESFFKTGITTQDNLRERFQGKRDMPYKYEVIIFKEIKEDPMRAYDIEQSLISLHKQVSYEPLKSFSGSTECFNELLIDIEKVKML